MNHDPFKMHVSRPVGVRGLRFVYKQSLDSATEHDCIHCNWIDDQNIVKVAKCK